MAWSSMTQTLKYAMDVPRAVTGDTPTWGVNELGRSLGLHKSTVSGLLATMEQRRLVQKEPVADRYRLGLGALELAATVNVATRSRTVSSPMRSRSQQRASGGHTGK